MTGTRVLLLHGYEHRRPGGHWMWWLAEQLREARIPVQYPQLPRPEEPQLEDWREIAHGELEMLAGGAERVVIAHSLGSILWLHHARTLDPALQVDRVLLVAPPHPDRLQGRLASFALGDVETDAVARAARSSTLVARDEDPYRPCPVDELAAAWGVESVTLAGAGHLNPDDGHGPWQPMLDWTLTGGVEWRVADTAH